MQELRMPVPCHLVVAERVQHLHVILFHLELQVSLFYLLVYRVQMVQVLFRQRCHRLLRL
jgi:hypothetical protein